MSSIRRMDHMTWPEIEASKSKPVIVPIGSTEQHSQHLPLGVDAMIASHVSEDLAERIDGIMAPTMNYGYKSKPLSGGGPLFPGTIDMNGVTVINQMHDVLGELIADGFTKIVVMNAHFENEAFIIEAIDLITRGSGHHRRNQLVGSAAGKRGRAGVRRTRVPRLGVGTCRSDGNLIDDAL